MITQDSLSCKVFLTELNQSFSEAFTEEVQNRESVSALSNDKRIHLLLEERIGSLTFNRLNNDYSG